MLSYHSIIHSFNSLQISNSSALIMTFDIRKRDTLFLDSDSNNFKKNLISSSKHNISVSRITQEQVRRIHLKNEWSQSSNLTISEKRFLREKSNSHLFDSSYKKDDKITRFKRMRIKRRIKRSLRVIYHEFMNLDQIKSTIMNYDNVKQCNLIIIKRLKKIDKNLMCEMRLFTNDYVINIKDMYFNNDDLIIVYKLMNIFLRAIINIL